MALVSSPPIISPVSFVSSPDTMPSRDRQSRSSSSYIPLQQSISSASQIPTPSLKSTQTTTPMSPNQYIEHHRKFMDHQRQLWDEERELWNIERQGLHLRVKELEDIVRKLGGQSGAVPGTGIDQTQTPGIPLLCQQPPSRTGSSGDEFWRGAGGRSDAKPTRSFSGDSDVSHGPHTTLSSITEDDTPKKKSVGFSGVRAMSPEGPQDFHVHPIPTMPVPRIPSDMITASLDGVAFKSPAFVKVFSSHSATPSPLHSPSPGSLPVNGKGNGIAAPPPADPRPVLLDLPRSGLQPHDLLVKDAGHTPLARLTDASSITSSHETPTIREPEVGQLPLEPRPSIVRPPMERSDSYFPPVEPSIPEEEPEEDRALQEPLGLKGDPSSKENDKFLSALDSKLLQAQRSNSLDATDDTDDSFLRKVRSADDKPEFEKLEGEEPEPRLRIKRSMNFGSAFGSIRRKF